MSHHLSIGKFLMFFGLLATASPSHAVDTDPLRVLTVRKTRVYHHVGASLAACEEVPPLTALTVDGSIQDLVDTSGTVYRPVLRVPGRTDWVGDSDIIPLPDSPPSSVGLPALIAKQPANVQRAWIEVDRLIRENQTLKAPLPQPYLARAEIWGKASNYEEAVKDMLTASKLTRRRGASLAEQTRMMGRVQELLEQLARTPRPRYFGDAEAQYRAGFEAFYQGQLEAALRHFDSAVQFMPEDKVYWYYRALTNKRLNHEAEAERDITIAVFQERSVARDQPKWWLGQFTRVQGPLRNWMESYRSGLPLAR
jgi:hypothetical protein